MAVVTVKGVQATNRDATPPIISDGRVSRSSIKESSDYVTVTSGDSIASKYILGNVPSSARVSDVLLSCAAITSGAADVGVYRNTADGGAVVSAGFFGTAVSIASVLTNSSILNESTTNTVDKQNQPLWQALGLSADPMTTFDIVATLTAAAAATGFLGLRVRYADNSN